MLDSIYNMQYNYRSRYLGTIDNENARSFSKYDTYHFKEPLLTLKPNEIYLGKSRICAMAKMSGVNDHVEFDGVTILENVDNEYYFRETIQTILDAKLLSSLQTIKISYSYLIWVRI